LNLEIEVV